MDGPAQLPRRTRARGPLAGALEGTRRPPGRLGIEKLKYWPATGLTSHGTAGRLVRPPMPAYHTHPTPSMAGSTENAPASDEPMPSRRAEFFFFFSADELTGPAAHPSSATPVHATWPRCKPVGAGPIRERPCAPRNHRVPRRRFPPLAAEARPALARRATAGVSSHHVGPSALSGTREAPGGGGGGGRYTACTSWAQRQKPCLAAESDKPRYASSPCPCRPPPLPPVAGLTCSRTNGGWRRIEPFERIPPHQTAGPRRLDRHPTRSASPFSRSTRRRTALGRVVWPSPPNRPLAAGGCGNVSTERDRPRRSPPAPESGAPGPTHPVKIVGGNRQEYPRPRPGNLRKGGDRGSAPSALTPKSESSADLASLLGEVDSKTAPHVGVALSIGVHRARR